MSQWQPIESAPKDGSEFLTFIPDLDSHFDIAGYDAKDDCFWKVCCGYQYVTAWHPIPDDWRPGETAPESGAYLRDCTKYGIRVQDDERAYGWRYPTPERWQPLPDPPA